MREKTGSLDPIAVDIGRNEKVRKAVADRTLQLIGASLAVDDIEGNATRAYWSLTARGKLVIPNSVVESIEVLR